ncbi:hypothetical protein MNBD_GAMMA08-3156 [hydrothermal vent metagenome]|uniref:DUF4124 domain-containing protein n=1 Tax=hydrothermal vent metagenome TaxID=652676 RepID=A0A3B0XY98_9ZZZZ
MITNKKKLNPYLKHIILFASLALMSSMSFAGIYKWVDDEGNVHYGQQRPKDASSQKMNVPQHAPRDTSSYKRPGQKDANAKTNNAQANGSAKKEPEKKKETKAEKKRRLAACAQTREKLTRMESIGRIRVVDKDGNTTYMSQKQKEERMAKDRKSLAKHCK